MFSKKKITTKDIPYLNTFPARVRYGATSVTINSSLGYAWVTQLQFGISCYMELHYNNIQHYKQIKGNASEIMSGQDTPMKQNAIFNHMNTAIHSLTL